MIQQLTTRAADNHDSGQANQSDNHIRLALAGVFSFPAADSPPYVTAIITIVPIKAENWCGSITVVKSVSS
jgi:hypothetical protein